MQLFLFLNDLAGRWLWLDELFRFLYIATVPLLGTLLLARLTLVSKAPTDPSRSRVVLATVLAVALSVLTMLAINGLASALHLGVLSPRPFMTRRVNLLIVEPQDNSFPAPEMMVAAVFAVALAALGRRWAIAGSVLTLSLGVARLYCGNNYGVDVLVGVLIGAAWAALTLALLQAPLRGLARPLQTSWSSALLGCTFLGIYLGLTFQPRFAAKLYAPWTSPATAAPVAPASQIPGAPRHAEGAITSARDARVALQEGEGVAETEDAQHEAELLALSKRSNLFLPDVEAFLRGRLAPRARPFTLLDVEIAPVKAGSTSYRCAAVRFEITRNVPHLRQQVAECAARLVKLSFALDSQVQNVDVIAILRGDGQRIDRSDTVFIGDEVPVFTASVQRKHLILQTPAWANASRLDGGSWLRFRSRLFVNERVLPAVSRATEPVVQPPGQTALPTVTPTARATPLPPTPQPSPTSTTSLSPSHPSPPLVPALPQPTATRPPQTPHPTTPAPAPSTTPTRLSPTRTSLPTPLPTRAFTPFPSRTPTAAPTPVRTPPVQGASPPQPIRTARPALKTRRTKIRQRAVRPRYDKAVPRKSTSRKPFRSRRLRRRYR